MRTIHTTDILIPKACAPSKWAVVACDQFTSEPSYWQALDEYVGNDKSTLRLIFPEVYLAKDDENKRIQDVNSAMKAYLEDGTFEVLKDSFVLVKRTTANGVSRLGIVLAIDLEDYCFTHPSHAHVRSTEGVVAERIPPRLEIRKDAPLELPHVMLLIDDRKHSVIEPLWSKRAELRKIYDFDLNMGGGHLEGYQISSKEVIDAFDCYVQSISNLYGTDGNDFIFAVGDGNHSLATAQAHWNNVKVGLSEEEKANHPARYALCEVENLHDDGITFEPIHRFVFGAGDDLIVLIRQRLSGDGKVCATCDGVEYVLSVEQNSPKAIRDIQTVVDEYVSLHDGCVVDYIHGANHLEEIAKDNHGVAIYMPAIKKDELFEYVLKNGTLCRKAFSMGEAEEKRYYFEAKKIVG